MQNRRAFLKQAAALPGGAAAVSRVTRGADEMQPFGNELPDMLLNYLANGLNTLAAEWDGKRAAIRTAAALEKRNRFVQARCIEMIHGLPARTPLKPVVVRRLERDGYRIEVVMFESQPDFRVTASLYVPTTGKGPFPGIISPCGHYPDARLHPEYQYLYLSLVRQGFAVLAYDPIGQGERRYFWNPLTNRNEIGGPVTWEHSLAGQLLLLVGEDLARYRIWDGMRSMDYLLSRPEVDPERIGCCGHSGGGTMTLFISALDERVKCVAVNEGGTDHAWPVIVRPEMVLGTGDAEQHFFPAAIYGIDFPDLHTAIAPRPLLATVEHFSRPGFKRAADEIRARYELMGVGEKFSTVEAGDPHAMTMKLRLATTDWFCRWFHNRRGPEAEPDFKLESAADMNCTAVGSLRYAGLGDSIFGRIYKKQAELPPAGRQAGVRLGEVERVLRYRRREGPLAARQLAVTQRRRYQIEKLEFLCEPGIYIPAWVFVPDERGPDRRALLYISEAGKQAEALEFGALERLTQHGNLVISVDVRGIGETRPSHPDSSGRGTFGHVNNGETAMQYMAWVMDRSLFGMRVQDVVRSVDYAFSRPDVDRAGIRAVGRGEGALWLLFAAALDRRISHSVCEGGLLSYRTLTASDRYLHDAGIFLPDALLHFDLPDVAAAVADRHLAILSPVDAMKSPVDQGAAQAAYGATARAYEAAGSAGRFVVSCGCNYGSRVDEYLRLLRG
ncbi:MAG: acetylxylan esterase [Bryobacterales bacterium]|nr:acetylxylan esterase [Bryobacterales bacterium]